MMDGESQHFLLLVTTSLRRIVLCQFLRPFFKMNNCRPFNNRQQQQQQAQGNQPIRQSSGEGRTAQGRPGTLESFMLLALFIRLTKFRTISLVNIFEFRNLSS